MKPAAVVVSLLVLLCALAPSSVSASVVAEVEIEGEKILAPSVFPFNFGTQPLGNIATVTFTLCFQLGSSPPGSCDHSGTVSQIQSLAPPFYLAGAFRETVATGTKTPITLPTTLGSGQRLVLFNQWVTQNLGNASDTHQLRVQPTGSGADDLFLDFMGFGVVPGSCLPTSQAVCLNNDRFKVKSHFLTDAASSGAALANDLTSDTGFLTFFNPSNVEAVIKVLNACGVNNRYWVFAGGLTDVRTVITVTDTQRDAVKTYVNPRGTRFQPIQDTSAFATCP